MGITSDFLKSRVSTPTLGKWSSGFSAVKKYADDNKLPLVGVWSNGDACGYCKKFETACMDAEFVKWMESSKIVFWFGYSGDKTADDKSNGTGFKWARSGTKLSKYPFVRVWWEAGKVDACESGNYWIDSSATGGMKFAAKVADLLKAYKPGNSANESDGCDGGSCGPDSDCCDQLEEVCDLAETAIAKLDNAIAAAKEARLALEKIESNCQVKG